MKLSAALLLTVVCSLSSTSSATCLSKRTSRKRQRAKLENLTSDDIVIEANYLGVMDNTHRFSVEQTWHKNNGGLNREDEIKLDASSSSFVECFADLRVRDNYILMMKEVDVVANVFRPTEAPVPSQRKKHRQTIWLRLCKTLDEDPNTCEMRITLPSTTIFYRGSMKMIECKVESSSDIMEVLWYKDDQNVDTTMHRIAGIFVDKSDSEKSFLMFRSTNHVHNGMYKCTAKNKNGQKAEAVTQVTVIGPKMKSHFTDCKEANYCFHGGLCRQFVDEEAVPMCECALGYTGKRCEDIADDITASSLERADQMEIMRESLSQLTTAVAAVSIALAVVLIIGFLYIKKLRKRPSSKTDSYDVVRKCGPGDDQSEDDLQATRYTTNGTTSTSVRLSVMDGPDTTESRRSSQNLLRSKEGSLLQPLCNNNSADERLKRTGSTKSSIHDELEVKTLILKPLSRNSSVNSERGSFKRDRLTASS